MKIIDRMKEGIGKALQYHGQNKVKSEDFGLAETRFEAQRKILVAMEAEYKEMKTKDQRRCEAIYQEFGGCNFHVP